MDNSQSHMGIIHFLHTTVMSSLSCSNQTSLGRHHSVLHTMLTRLASFYFWSRCWFISGIWAPVSTQISSSVGLDNAHINFFVQNLNNLRTFPDFHQSSHAGQAHIEILVVKGADNVLIPTVAQSLSTSVFDSSLRMKLGNQLAFRNLLVAFYKLGTGTLLTKTWLPCAQRASQFPTISHSAITGASLLTLGLPDSWNSR